GADEHRAREVVVPQEGNALVEVGLRDADVRVLLRPPEGLGDEVAADLDADDVAVLAHLLDELEQTEAGAAGEVEHIGAGLRDRANRVLAREAVARLLAELLPDGDV